VSVIAFWITFVLAQTGVEHGAVHHIGVFRALSVLRTARLLSITSGTTVSDYDICIGVGWTRFISYFLDYHALSQDCASVACKCGLFCAFCHGIALVRFRFRSTARASTLTIDFAV
jgi:hypothetical protein